MTNVDGFHLEHSLIRTDLDPSLCVYFLHGHLHNGKTLLPFHELCGCRHTDDNRIRCVRGKGEHKAQDQKETDYRQSPFHAFPPFIWVPPRGARLDVKIATN